MPKNILKDKRILISGGAKRIGRAIAESAACHGAHVAIQHLDTETDAARETAEELERYNVSVYHDDCSFADTRDIDRFYDALCKSFGPPDFLVNNASDFRNDSLESLTDKSFHEMMHINSFAPLHLARRFAHQTRAGAIVNIIDTRVYGCDPVHVPYYSSKGVLKKITELMAVSFAPGIRVNAVAPGSILAPVDKTTAPSGGVVHRNLLNRMGDPVNIADAVVFLLENDFINGHTLVVDGGERLKTVSYE